MSDTDPIRDRLQAITARYRADFAGHPRVSRDLELLQRLVDELKTLAADAPPDLREDIERTHGTYAEEVEAVRAAKAAGPDEAAVQHQLAWVRFAHTRYRLHFAGKSRSTRDLGLLAEIIDTLERADVELTAIGKRYGRDRVEGARAEIEDSLRLYRDERGAVAAARGGGTLADQANVLASVANDQFAVYRSHFAGKKRLSRRPALLSRVVGNLEQALDRMSALQAQGHHDERNDRNLEIVQERLGLYRRELEEVRRARQQTDMSALILALGAAAKEVTDKWTSDFAGQSRETRDLALIGQMFDELHDLALQMDDLDRVRDDSTNQHNLAAALDELRLYDREERLIREAQDTTQT